MEAIPGTLQAQLQQRQVLTGEIQRAMAMSQVNSRVDAIEKVLGGKLGDTVKMLQELAGSQKAPGGETGGSGRAQALANRIVDWRPDYRPWRPEEGEDLRGPLTWKMTLAIANPRSTGHYEALQEWSYIGPS